MQYQLLLLYAGESGLEMRSEDGFTVGGAREPGEAGADAVGPVVSTASVPYVGLL